jgi:outer membrane lipoprotein-sorting protein
MTYNLALKLVLGNPITDYISDKSFLVLKRDLFIASNTSEETDPVTETYSDYRAVDGQLLPFKTVSYSPNSGNTVLIVKDVKFNVGIPDSVFQAQTRAINR